MEEDEIPATDVREETFRRKQAEAAKRDQKAKWKVFNRSLFMAQLAFYSNGERVYQCFVSGKTHALIELDASLQPLIRIGLKQNWETPYMLVNSSSQYCWSKEELTVDDELAKVAFQAQVPFTVPFKF